MAGRKPDYRLVVPSDSGRGKTTYHRIGGAWLNEEGETKSIGIQVNAGVPLVRNPGQKLVLFENKDDDPSFDQS
jgi:hypothetical protein